MATIREWLNAAGFDWDRGVLIYQAIKMGESDYPGWASDDQLKTPIYIDKTHAILDAKFSSGYGGPECPRFFARDSTAIYFPGQYDGATWCEKVVIDPEAYIQGLETPYPGS